MKRWQVLQTIFPEVITENFDFIDYQKSEKRLDYWLEEREYMSREDFLKGTVRSHSFTEESVIQDFPISGKAVYLNVKQRRWIDKADGSTFVYNNELAEEGIRHTPEFCFLRYRLILPKSICSIGRYYDVNGKSLAYQYKEFFSDYRQWKQLDHASEYLLFPDNIDRIFA